MGIADTLVKQGASVYAASRVRYTASTDTLNYIISNLRLEKFKYDAQ